MANVVATVTELVTPILEENTFELVDIEYVKEGRDWFLRVFIDKSGGIDINECVLVSEQLSDILDSLDPDPIPHAYFLEVSSPGAERPLKKEEDYLNAVNEYINVSLYQAIDGEKQYQGFLKEVTEETLTLLVKIKTREKIMSFDRKNIAKARLAIQF
ncbi:ribosome maturation factor RimP [Vagococcus vulneris]|uniref:Ribosome maturation factor RimP n=1 Tax=Vagococcus vulneris TaxID=1977869 RepID=A0A429ZXZ8_9ENTE|nr:ribosome maturation factor RimP [Vagococcus vulneris]RST98782.1 ribosome maturation factor RimP [Vagococcus vulneris]